MLRITPKPTFVAETSLHVPGEEETAKIKVTFKFLNREQIADWQKRNLEKPVNVALEEIIADWEGVFFEDGLPAPYNPENLKKLLIEYHTASDDFTMAYFREILGARRKN